VGLDGSNQLKIPLAFYWFRLERDRKIGLKNKVISYAFPALRGGL
jgi:hypothetical protein